MGTASKCRVSALHREALQLDTHMVESTAVGLDQCPILRRFLLKKEHDLRFHLPCDGDWRLPAFELHAVRDRAVCAWPCSLGIARPEHLARIGRVVRDDIRLHPNPEPATLNPVPRTLNQTPEPCALLPEPYRDTNLSRSLSATASICAVGAV